MENNRSGLREWLAGGSVAGALAALLGVVGAVNVGAEAVRVGRGGRLGDAVAERHAPTPIWRYRAIEDATVKASADLSVGAWENLIDGKMKPQAYFSSIEGVTVSVSLNHPRHIEALGVLTPAWDSWATPLALDVRVNGSAPRRITVRGAGIAPNADAPERGSPVIIPIRAQVSSLEVTVVDAERPSVHNTVGSIELLEAERGPDRLDFTLTGGIPDDAAGVRLFMNSRDPVRQMNVRIHTGNRPYRRLNEGFDGTYWLSAVNSVSAGESVVDLTWEQFVNPTAPELQLNPLNAFMVEVEQVGPSRGEVGLTAWEFIGEGDRLQPAWEHIVIPPRAPDGEGWRMGVPSNGFGRFGWTQSSGLLVGDISMGSFTYFMLNGRNEDRSQAFIFHDGEKGRPTHWRRSHIDWTSVVHQERFGEGAKMSWADDVGSRPWPVSLTYSVLAPGFLVDSDLRRFAFGIEAKDARAPLLLYVDAAEGLKWVDSSVALDGARMARGWVVAVWPDQPNMPIVFAPQRRPKTITSDGGLLEFIFPGRLQRIAIGTPSGFRWWEGSAGLMDADTAQLAEHAQHLASILRAYPKTSSMQFKDDQTHVRIRETVGHVIWDNEWNEPSTVIAPIPPMVSFAYDQQYPSIELPEAVKDLGVPTKIGPYRYVDGSTVEYRLPVPPVAGRMYLRPSGEHALADDVAGKMAQTTNIPDEPWQITNLLPWSAWAPQALGLTLMNESQRRNFLDAWKVTFDVTLTPFPWQLRREPWTGQRYLYSYAWMHHTSRTFGDIISGHGAFLYACDLYARASGDWETMEANWPLVNAVMQFYHTHHDWAHLQVPCHESSGATAFDMELIAYLGAVGYTRMAETLGREDDAAMGRLILARLGVPLSVRWLGARWVAPELCGPVEVPFSSPGLTDEVGFVRTQSPHWHIGLSLTWKGPFYEAFAAQLWGAGKEFWHYFQKDLIEQVQPSLWTEDSWYRIKNVAAHLYMRGLLGIPTDAMVSEIERQGELGILGLSPTPREARLYAPLYAMIIGRDHPMTLRNWGRAALLSGTYDEHTNTARIEFECAQPFEVELALRQPAVSHDINGVRHGTVEAGDAVIVALPAGRSRLELQF